MPLAKARCRPAPEAEEAGVTERTIYRWLEEPEFKAALWAAEGQLLVTITARLSDEAAAAVATLAEIHADPTQPGGVRVRAAATILTRLLKIRDQREILARIEELEERLMA